jgi:hypothetical protein
MTRTAPLRWRLALSCSWIALLASCEWIAGIPERTQINDPCTDFCARTTRLCTAEFTIYKPEECPAVCALYSTEDRQCRLDELKKLEKSGEDEANLYCANASLSGGKGVCGGSGCKNYCETMSKVCADHVEPTVSLPEADGTNAEECERKCAVIPDRESLSRGTNESTFDVKRDHEGDTLQCRFVHLSLAAQGEELAKDHCTHAFVNPQPMNGVAPPWCGSPKTDGVPTCEDYCHVNTSACVDDLKVYDNEMQCLNVCKSAALPLGKLDMTAGSNSIACRKNHSYNAAVYNGLGGTHCPHSGPGGAGVCGNDCESLCLLVAKSCPDEYESEYKGSTERCQKACDDAAKADPKYNKGMNYSVANAKRGDAFACRLYHAALASSFANDAQAECSVAVGTAACPFPEKKP